MDSPMPDYNLFDERPDQNGIIGLRDHLSEVWRATATQKWDKAERYIHGEQAVWPNNKGRPEARTPTARRLVDQASDTQLADEPIFRRNPVGRGEHAKEYADAIEPWLTAMFHRASMLETVTPARVIAKELMSLGYAVLEGPTMVFENKPKEPMRDEFGSEVEFKDAMDLYHNDRDNWMPFRLSAPHPTEVLLDPRQKIPEVAIKVGKKYAGDIWMISRSRMGRRLKTAVEFPKRSNIYEEVDYTEQWTRKYHAFMAEDALLFIEPNGGGFVPFNQAFSGYGIARGGKDGRDPKWLSDGILVPAYSTIDRIEQEVSTMHKILLDRGHAPRGVKAGVDVANIVAQEARGEYLEGLNPDDVWSLQYPTIPSDMFQANEVSRRDLELATYSAQAAGFKQKGVVTVGQQEILSTSGNLKFVSPKKQMENMFEIAASNMLRLTDRLNQRITIDGFTIGSKEIAKRFGVGVSFEVVDPVLELSQKQFALTEYQTEVISLEDYWALSRKEDATGMRKRLAKDKLRRHPSYTNAALAGQAEEEGLEVLAERFREESKNAEKAAALSLAPPDMQATGQNGSSGV